MFDLFIVEKILYIRTSYRMIDVYFVSIHV